MGPDKNSISLWWICIFISVMLWYRNNGQDRIFASIFFVVGFLQLIDYGVKGGMNRNHAGKLAYLSIWLICLITSFAVYIYTRSPIAGAMATLFTIIFVVVVASLFSGKGESLDSGYSPRVVEYEGSIYNWVLYPIYGQGGSKPILGSYWWLWAIGIILSSVILLNHTRSWSLALILVFIIATYFICRIIAPGHTAILWAYSSITILFFVWVVGMFDPKK